MSNYSKIAPGLNKDSQWGVLVQIQDFRIGISEDDLPYLFTRFFRGKNASSVKGTGLGLAIAKEYVSMHVKCKRK